MALAQPGQHRGANDSDGVMRIKPIDVILRQGAGEARGLKRSLGPLSLTFMGVGAIIGTGIFVLTGVAAARYAGPALVLSFVLAGLVSGLAALCYAEFASTVPISGSAYTYSYATLGELVAWIIGWDLILEYGVGSAAVSIGWSSYFTDSLKSIGITLPTVLAASPFSGGVINLPAAIIILLVTALLIRGTSESAKVNNVIVAIKLAVVLFFLIVGVAHIHSGNWTPFLPFGWRGVLSGAGIIFFAYIGFDTVATSAEEARNPGRDLPLGIILSLLICTVLYIAVAAVLTGMVPFGQLDVASPVSHAMILVGLNWAAGLISLGAICGLTTVLIILLFSQSRIFFSMSRDGLLPGIFSRIHPGFRTPFASNLVVGVTVAALAAFTPIDVVAELTNIGTLAAFVLVSIAVIILRRTQPGLHRAFRMPLVPALPVLSALGALVLIFSLRPVTLVRFVVWLAIGLVIYFAYSRRNSTLNEPAPGPQRGLPHDEMSPSGPSSPIPTT